MTTLTTLAVPTGRLRTPGMMIVVASLFGAAVAIMARRPVLPGWGRWLAPALGAYVFVPMFLAVFGPMVLGRVAVGVWLLMFAALGVALMRADS
jgi:hypothetical protein